jgi:RHS repeat-associated protein
VAAGGLPGWAGHSVALTSDGNVWAWGYGKSGQLGRGTIGSSATAAKVPGLTGVIQVAAGGDNSYALKSDGTVWAWGDNSYGQIGNSRAGKTQSSPIQVTGLSNVTAIGAGGVMAFAVTADGTVWGWGDDNTGQLGDGAACGKICGHPVRVGSIGNGVIATGGYVHGLAAVKDGTVRAWGSNTGGQLGDGTTTVRPTPVTVSGLSGVTTAGGSVRAQYSYDGDGLRQSRTASGTTSSYTWDVASATPLLLTDSDWSYVYGPGGAPIEQVAGDGTTQYLHGDQVGSTRLVTDASGATVATFAYSPYGVLEGKTGNADTRLRFAGQYQDDGTGLYYLRARYYDPVTAQFLTRDPLEPLTQAAYGYAGGNPLTFVDPTGLDWWNPFSWSGKTWAAVGTGVAVVGLTVATAGVGDVVIVGGVAVTEVTADVVVSEVGYEATFTAASYVEGGLTVQQVVSGAGYAVAAGATIRGGYDTYQCVAAQDPSRALECGMDAGATVLSAFDPFLGLSELPEYLYNLFGLGWAFATPEAEACGAGG